jgi:hypothetical protein
MNAGIGFFGLLLIVAISVALSRWIFRINDIVNRLDRIVELMSKGELKPPVPTKSIDCAV